ncbi:hypothetical protein M8494_25355 [Serratia ureilytica]
MPKNYAEIRSRHPAALAASAISRLVTHCMTCLEIRGERQNVIDTPAR